MDINQKSIERGPPSRKQQTEEVNPIYHLGKSKNSHDEKSKENEEKKLTKEHAEGKEALSRGWSNSSWVVVCCEIIKKFNTRHR